MTSSGPVPSSTPSHVIARQAADFFQRRRFWDWSEADQAELDAWLAQSFEHRAAYLRVEAVAARAEQFAALGFFKFDPPAADRDARRFYWKFFIPLFATAAIGLVATLGFPLFIRFMQPPDRIYATGIGGHTILNFSDHTQVELDTDTVARFRMTTKERTVWLEKGQAWFHVAHDADNPFSVVVSTHRVTDLGTEFLVRKGADGMEVALLAGRATLSTEGAAAATLVPGDDALATGESLSVTKKTAQELADALAWRQGVLVFRNARLADAVKEFNRYNRSKLLISDPSVADLKLSVEIRSDNFEGFIHIAQTMLGLRADWRGHDVMLSRGAREKAKGGGSSRRDD